MLAAEQRLIADETEQLRLKMADQSAFAFALEGARQEMLRAAALLAARRDEHAHAAGGAGRARLVWSRCSRRWSRMRARRRQHASARQNPPRR